MSRIDELIEQALNEQDQALLNDMANEPGYFRQAFGLFRGRLGWVMWLVMVVQLACFGAALWALWHLFGASELMSAIRYGVVAIVLVQIGTFLRGFMGDHFEANRILREFKRLELRLVQLNSRD